MCSLILIFAVRKGSYFPYNTDRDETNRTIYSMNSECEITEAIYLIMIDLIVYKNPLCIIERNGMK